MSVLLAAFIICGLHFYVWLAVKHELHNQVHMWKSLRGETEVYGQLQSVCHYSFKYERFRLFAFFTEKSFLQLLPHDMNATWTLDFWAL